MPSLERVHARNGVVWLRSAMLADAGIRHGFSTRHGGVSNGPFASLNLAGGRSTGGEDQPSALEENRRRLVEALSLDDLVVAVVRQVHGAAVATADACIAGAGPRDGADAIFTGPQSRAACMIRVADCVPILVADLDAGTVAAIHAGWRGIVAGVIAATIGAMRQHGGARGARLSAAIGPCAGVESFEVGDEVADEFDSVALGVCVHRRPAWPRPHVDLFDAVHRQLVAAGVGQGAIDGTPLCTISRGEDFFSHRRDAGVTGRMAAMITPRSA